MSAGSKIKDDKQQYALSHMGPSYVSPSGHELSFYETEDNERLVVRHSTGSHLEFKADGSIFIKSIKDLHLMSSVVSDQSGGFDGSVKGADHTTINQKTDLGIDVEGRLTIKCKELDLEVGSNALMKASNDFKIEADNIINKSAGQGSYEATKSLYFDSKEKRERFSSSVTEIGTEENKKGIEGGSFKPIGGVNVINVMGNTVIENADPSGGITISAAGYLNLVAGGERVDITGKWGPISTGKKAIFQPSQLAKPFSATYTNLVFQPGGGDKKNQYNAPKGTGGSLFQMTEGSGMYDFATKNATAPASMGNGHLVNVMKGNKTENVIKGGRFRKVKANEDVIITGVQTIQAKYIFLN